MCDSFVSHGRCSAPYLSPSPKKRGVSPPTITPATGGGGEGKRTAHMMSPERGMVSGFGDPPLVTDLDGRHGAVRSQLQDGPLVQVQVCGQLLHRHQAVVPLHLLLVQRVVSSPLTRCSQNT